MSITNDLILESLNFQSKDRVSSPSNPLACYHLLSPGPYSPSHDLMNFAINFSHKTAALVAKGLIDIDYFKCPDWPDLISEALRYRPIAVHFTLRAGTGLLPQTDWGHIEQMLQLTKTPYVNLHLETRTNDFPTESNTIPSYTQEPAHINMVVERLLLDVSAVVDHFGPERVIAENVPYWGANGTVLRPASEASVIRRVVEETGCGLLLDISHARITARYLGIDETKYLAGLPVERVRELHIAGIHTVEEGWQDHLPMLAEDWPWLDKALEAVNNGSWGPAWLIAFEYGGEGGWFADHTDPAVIADQVPEFRKRIKADG
jgi:uncharacterized protein (UPF0276 family)